MPVRGRVWLDRPQARQTLAKLQAKSARKRLMTGVARDPKTGQVRRGAITRTAGRVELRLPKRLPSPNEVAKLSWRARHYGLRRAWLEVIQTAAIDSCRSGKAFAVQTSAAGAVGWMAPPDRAHVEVLRLVRQAGHLMTDQDNEQASVKQLLDCLKATGFILDDRRPYASSHVTQGVSPDGQDWTIVTITAPESRC